MGKVAPNKQYDYESLFRMSKDLIEAHNLTSYADIIAFLPCCEKTFYVYKLQDSQELKELLTANKVKTKLKLRKMWLEDGSPATQIALYKLLGTSEERDALNGNNRVSDHDSDQTEFEVVDNLHDED
jgi:hypothetical protein